MTRKTLADRLRRAIIAALGEFRAANPSETPYALALVGGQEGELLYAVATEQGLLRTVDSYIALGYRYRGPNWRDRDDREMLSIWLRWENPDDGWAYGDLPECFGISPALREKFEEGAFGEGGDDFEE